MLTRRSPRRLIRDFFILVSGGAAFAQPLLLGPPQRQPDGGVRLELHGPASVPHRVDFATVLPFWSALELLPGTNVTRRLTDPAGGAAARF